MNTAKETHIQSVRIELIHQLDAAWNEGDLEKILEFYSEDFVLDSPIVRARLGIENGILQGKAQVREWWRRCLDKVPDLKTDVINIVGGTDPDSIAYVYRLEYKGGDGSPVLSLLRLNEQNKVCHETFYSRVPA